MTPLGDDRLLDDSVLIARLLAQQDDAAFELLMARHRPQVARVCLAILKDRDDAEDAVQEVFAKVLHKLESFRGESFAGWVTRIARNHSLNVLARRRELAGLPVDLERALWQESTPEESSVEVEILLQELGKLPEGQRVCLKLHYADGYSYSEIVDLTGYTWDMVKSHIQNGKHALEKRIGQRLAGGRMRKTGTVGY